MSLSQQAKAAKCAYQKAWARRNPDKVRHYIEDYWERKGAEMNDPKAMARELSVNGFTQRQISEKLGISVGTVNAILNKE